MAGEGMPYRSHPHPPHSEAVDIRTLRPPSRTIHVEAWLRIILNLFTNSHFQYQRIEFRVLFYDFKIFSIVKLHAFHPDTGGVGNPRLCEYVSGSSG